MQARFVRMVVSNRDSTVVYVNPIQVSRVEAADADRTRLTFGYGEGYAHDWIIVCGTIDDVLAALSA